MDDVVRKILILLVGVGSIGSWIIYQWFTNDIRDALLSIWLLIMFVGGMILDRLEEIYEDLKKNHKVKK